MTVKFYTEIDHHSLSSNMKKHLHKINDVMDGDVIILRSLSVFQKYPKIYKTNAIISVIYGCIMMKFCTGVAYDKTIPHTKLNCHICTDVIDNDVILLKFERFRRKALNFKRLYLSSLWMKHGKNC